ncbi:MAG: glycosyltransferase [Actinomycetota bacterium]|nr:glycosyltransferase [Actinomycetota bacterium]
MNSVGLVFVSTNEGSVLIPAIESAKTSDVRRPLSIVVVDNASTDGSAHTISERWPDVRILKRSERNGLPSNLNHGIKASTDDYVMLCNSDLIFGPHAIETLASFLDEHEDAGIVAPKLLAPDGSIRSSARRWYTIPVLFALKGPWRRWVDSLPAVKRNLYQDWKMDSPLKVDWVPCPATMVRRKALEDVGLMDERFRLYFDDVDISLRMHEKDWEVWCEPGAEIVHLEQRASVRPLTKAWRWHLVSLFKFWWKHKGLGPKTRVPRDQKQKT